MAIRFQCPSCQQPIETDDEWGGKIVACPYCRNTVTAPIESTLDPLRAAGPPPFPAAPGDTVAGELPGAPPPLRPAEYGPPGQPSVSGGPSSFASSQPFPPGMYAPQPVRSTRTIGIIALILASLAVLCAFGFMLILHTHGDEIKEFASKPGGTFLEQQQKLLKHVEAKYGTMPPWLMLLSLLPFLGGTLWLAALICAVFGVRAPDGRWPSIGAFILCGIAPFLCCCSMGLAGS